MPDWYEVIFYVQKKKGDTPEDVAAKVSRVFRGRHMADLEVYEVGSEAKEVQGDLASTR